MLKLREDFDSKLLPISIVERYRTVDGPTLKVALYLLCGNECSLERLCSELSMPSETVSRAIEYWHEAGLVSDDCVAPDTTQQPVKQITVVEQREQLSSDKISELMLVDSDISILLQETQNCLGRTLTSSESARLLTVYEYDGLPVDILLLIVAYAKEHSKRGIMSYIERVAGEWREQGLTTIELAEKHLKLLETRKEREKAVAELMNADAEAFKYREKKYISAWFEEYSYSLDMIGEAVTRGSDKGISYINSIIRDWHSKGFKTLKDTRNDISNTIVPGRSKKKNAKAKDDLFERALKHLDNEEK